MTKMKPRRIGSAFIDLDPLGVIREKDRKSRQASTANRTGGHSPATTKAKPSTAVTTSGEDQAGKSPKAIYNDHKKPTVGVMSTGNPSEPAEVAHVAGATKHAISKTQLSELSNASNSSPAAAKTKAKENSALLPSKLHMEATNRVESAGDDNATAAIKPADKMQHGSSLASSRPKRVARKRYTEVDWYEDLRPTDDESSKDDNGHGGSSVSSPEPEYTGSPAKPSSSKRKRRQSTSNSSKRRKGTKGKGKASDKKKAQKLQLPLTAAPTPLVDSLGANANPTSKKSDMQPGSSGTRRIAKDPANSLPPKAPEQDPKEDQNGTAQLEIIEISSASPLSTDESDPDHDMDQARTDMNQAVEAETHGRGRSMGQKLADALRDAGLTTQCLPITNIGSHLAQTSQRASMFQNSCSPVSCASSSRASLEDGALATDFDLAQVQSNPALTQQQEPEPIEPTIALLDMAPEACFETSSPVRGTAVCTDNSTSREPHSFQELSGSGASVDVASDEDVVDSQWVTLRDHSEAVPSPERFNNDSRRSISSHAEDSRAIIQNQPSETEDSSRSSAAAITDGQTALLTETSGNEHTPESQQPLLTKETPRRPIPMSIPRSSIVDDNGSPRLIERGRAGSLRFGRLLSLATTDSSQSSNERVSEDCPDDYTPHDRQSLSKFHLDMLLEYGIEAEDLFKRRSRSTLFRSHTTSGGTSLGGSRCMEQQSGTRMTTVSPRQSDDSSAVEKGTGDSEQDRASAAGPSSSQPTIDEVGLCINRSSGARNHHGKLPTTENANPSQPSSGSPRSIMQDNADGMAWISALQTAQRSAHSLLQQTNQNLSVQLAAEQDTIRQVLQIYRQGCNRILDDLFRAQEARMELYRQQMSSVKEQHTQICQELIRGLQELDHRVQQGA